MDDDLYYLQPGFEPNTLKVAELRGVLNKHNISFPSGAKKADLVALFNDELKPQARKLLSAHKKVNRTSRGIIDAVSSTASSTQVAEDENDEDMPPPPSSPIKKPRGRPKKAAKSEEDTDNTLVPRTNRPKSQVRTERKKSISRASTRTPASKNRDDDDDVPATWKKFDEDSPFTADNPFQSGGSSPPQPATISRRRRTDGPVSVKKEKESSSRRRTDGSKVVRQTGTAVKVPISAINYQEDEDEDGIEAGEEFTELEQQELEEERKSNKVAVRPVRRSKRSQGSGILTKVLLYGLGVLSLSAAGVWRQEKIHVGYCDDNTGPSEWTYKLPQWAQNNLMPSCEPCIPNAWCHENFKTECQKGYVLSQHPLSLGGLIPLAPACLPDGEFPRRVKQISDKITKGIHTRYADAECSGVDSRGNPVTTAEISQEEIKKGVRAATRRSLTDEEFNELFDSSISQIGQNQDITKTERDGQFYYRSTSTQQFPFLCSLRKSVITTLGRYLRFVIAAITIPIAALYLYSQFKSWLKQRQDAQLYASQVFNALAASADQEGYVSINRLRDDVLRSEFSSARRKKVWTAVEKLVEQNANVRTKVGATDSGDVGKGWRWIGGGDGSKGRRDTLTPSHILDVEEVVVEKKPNMSELQRWRDNDEPAF